MIKVEKTEQTSLRIKNAIITDNGIVDDEGETVDLMVALRDAFGDGEFSLSASSKSKEELPITEV